MTLDLAGDLVVDALHRNDDAAFAKSASVARLGLMTTRPVIVTSAMPNKRRSAMLTAATENVPGI
jgi:hypothetical protein